MEDEELEKLIVWFNKEDLMNPYKAMSKLWDIYMIKMVYGQCFILTEDLTKEQLERIFNA